MRSSTTSRSRASESTGTRTERRSICSSAPSLTRRVRAARTGMELTPISSASTRSFSFSPGPKAAAHEREAQALVHLGRDAFLRSRVDRIGHVREV
jgi:hypothetical protein